MPLKNIGTEILNALTALEDNNFEKFCDALLGGPEKPPITASEVGQKTRLHVTKLLVSRCTESGALVRVIRTLRDIGCNDEALRLESRNEARLAKKNTTSTPSPPKPQSVRENGKQKKPPNQKKAKTKAKTKPKTKPTTKAKTKPKTKAKTKPKTKAKAKPKTKAKAKPKTKATPNNSSRGGSGGSAAQQQHFVDRHRIKLIDRVSNVDPILDLLLSERVINQEQYDEIRCIPTSQNRIRFLYSKILKTSKTKDIFLSALEEHELFLIKDLRGD